MESRTEAHGRNTCGGEVARGTPDIEERLRGIRDTIDLALAEPGARPNPFLEGLVKRLDEVLHDIERARLGVG